MRTDKKVHLHFPERPSWGGVVRGYVATGGSGHVGCGRCLPACLLAATLPVWDRLLKTWGGRTRTLSPSWVCADSGALVPCPEVKAA